MSQRAWFMSSKLGHDNLTSNENTRKKREIRGPINRYLSERDTWDRSETFSCNFYSDMDYMRIGLF